ncbi:MAG: carboxypeptidase regulatory-like domain-containing protein [Dehalococcoidia bacterium]
MPITLQPGERRELDVRLTPIPVPHAMLFGYVTDASTHQPIAGAFIQLSGAYFYSGITNANGYYEIVDIVPGVYDGQVTATGYQPYTF